jgi:acyl carrier protein
MNGDALPAVTASLKTLLANELQMRESDVDENIEFVDLGLDSISGVTWIRKINEKYQTAIEATKVYSYPTLAQLARYVKKEAEKHGALSGPGATPATPSGGSPLSQSAVVTRTAAPG